MIDEHDGRVDDQGYKEWRLTPDDWLGEDSLLGELLSKHIKKLVTRGYLAESKERVVIPVKIFEGKSVYMSEFDKVPEYTFEVTVKFLEGTDNGFKKPSQRPEG